MHTRRGRSSDAAAPTLKWRGDGSPAPAQDSPRGIIHVSCAAEPPGRDDHSGQPLGMGLLGHRRRGARGRASLSYSGQARQHPILFLTFSCLCFVNSIPPTLSRAMTARRCDVMGKAVDTCCLPALAFILAGHLARAIETIQVFGLGCNMVLTLVQLHLHLQSVRPSLCTWVGLRRNFVARSEFV